MTQSLIADVVNASAECRKIAAGPGRDSSMRRNDLSAPTLQGNLPAQVMLFEGLNLRLIRNAQIP